ncbi:DUF892 family protein [Candidatus Roizmanbacteria bacterium]|nr:DUF892 family protein [Candidatus Roizmanbacteria bacterium]
MKLHNLQDLFKHELQDLYSAEEQIIEALPKLIDEASSQELTDALSAHLEKTREHLEIVKQIAFENGINPTGELCTGMEGLLKEGNHIVSLAADDDVRDAAIIMVAQRVEHYEISGYGSSIAHARELDLVEAISSLEGILEQEYEADTILSEIALSGVNQEAVDHERMYT